MTSTDMQDQSYSPATFDTLDTKAPSVGDERAAQQRKAGIAPSTFPKFPTIYELAKLETPPVKKEQPGVFEMYLDKNPAHILQDSATENRYDDQALSLLADLQQGSKSWAQLTPEEKGLLDEAALEYFHPQKKITVSPRPSSLAPSPPTVRTADGGSLPKVTPVDGPVLDAFWWT